MNGGNQNGRELLLLPGRDVSCISSVVGINCEDTCILQALASKGSGRRPGTEILGQTAKKGGPVSHMTSTHVAYHEKMQP